MEFLARKRKLKSSVAHMQFLEDTVGPSIKAHQRSILTGRNNVVLISYQG